MASSSSDKNNLPPEVLEYVLQHMDYRVLARLQTVCKSWKSLITEMLQVLKDPRRVDFKGDMFGVSMFIPSEMKDGETLGQTHSRLENEEPEVAIEYEKAIKAASVYLGDPHLKAKSKSEVRESCIQILSSLTDVDP